ncbi:hypothetical protein BaRGS_00012904, partial [Batillaria attramentaria]
VAAEPRLGRNRAEYAVNISVACQLQYQTVLAPFQPRDQTETTPAKTRKIIRPTHPAAYSSADSSTEGHKQHAVPGKAALPENVDAEKAGRVAGRGGTALQSLHTRVPANLRSAALDLIRAAVRHTPCVTEEQEGYVGVARQGTAQDRAARLGREYWELPVSQSVCAISVVGTEQSLVPSTRRRVLADV